MPCDLISGSLGLNAPLLWAGSFSEDLLALCKTKSPKEIGQFIAQSYEANKVALVIPTRAPPVIV
jgi:hypothetical protein